MNKKRNEEEKARKSALAESFWERTNTLIKQCGKTQREISLLLDKENPRKLQNWTAGKGLPDAEEAVVIANALNTTVEYLVTSKSDNGLSPDAMELAKMYDHTLPKIQHKVMDFVKLFADMTEENTFFSDEPPIEEDN